jgi:hypothetical protein
MAMVPREWLSFKILTSSLKSVALVTPLIKEKKHGNHQLKMT